MMMEFATKAIRYAKGRTKKHHVNVVCADEATLSGGYWNGGSRTSWYLISLSGQWQNLPLSYPTSPAQFGGAASPIVQIVPGTAIIRGGVFCGKDSTLTFMVHPFDLVAFLGIEGFELPADYNESDIAIMFDWLEERGYGELRPYKYDLKKELAADIVDCPDCGRTASLCECE